MMIGKMPSHQGRARGLYDEQLQRKQQEKALGLRGSIAVGTDRPAFRLDAPELDKVAEPAS
jgi:hypothetical protein